MTAPMTAVQRDIEELRQRASLHGFELVEKERIRTMGMSYKVSVFEKQMAVDDQVHKMRRKSALMAALSEVLGAGLILTESGPYDRDRGEQEHNMSFQMIAPITTQSGD
jgi:hypothetical protein